MKIFNNLTEFLALQQSTRKILTAVTIKRVLLESATDGIEIFERFSDALKECEELQTLYIHNGHADEDGLNAVCFRALWAALKKCPQLKKLSLQFNFEGLNPLEDSFLELEDTLKEYFQLHTLSLSFHNGFNNLTEDNFRAFCRVFKNCPQLRHLIVHGDDFRRISAEQFKIFCHELRKCHYLEQLSIIAPGFFADVGNFQEYCNTLKQLPRLRKFETHHANEWTIAHFAILGETLESCLKLQDLTLSMLRLDCLDISSFTIFCNSLGKCALLQSLKLEYNDLPGCKEIHFKLLEAALKQCPDLHTLNIDEDNFQYPDDNSFRALCNVFKQCPQLRYVSLNGSILTHDSHLATFYDWIRSGSHWQELDMRYTNSDYVDLPTFRQFCEALSNCSKLKILRISSEYLNKSDPAYIMSFCDALRKLPNLRTLELYLCDDSRTEVYEDLNETGFAYFLQAVKDCWNLTEILSLDHFSLQQADAIEEELQNHVQRLQVERSVQNLLPRAQKDIGKITEEKKFPSLLFLTSLYVARSQRADHQNMAKMSKEITDPIIRYRKNSPVIPLYNRVF